MEGSGGGFDATIPYPGSERSTSPDPAGRPNLFDDEMAEGTEEEEELSVQEMQEKLRAALRKSGAVETITARLRSQLVSTLTKQHGLMREDGTMAGRPPPSFEDCLVNSLIVDYLRHRGHVHTASIFLPEAHMTHKLLSRDDIAKALQLVEGTGLYRRLISDTDDEENPKKKRRDGQVPSILEKILGEFYMSYRGASAVTIATQTDARDVSGHRLSLDLQLRQIQTQFLESSGGEGGGLSGSGATSQAVELRMLAFQRECEDRARREVSLEVSRMREVEMAKVRSEEAARYRRELDTARDQLRLEYNDKLEKLQVRHVAEERRLEERVKHAEGAQFEARQRLLRELEVVKMRETDAGRLAEAQVRGLKLEELRIKELRADVEGRARAIERQEAQLALRIQTEVENARAEGARSYTAQVENVRAEREFLEQEMDRVRAERSACQEQMAQLSELSRTVAQQRASLVEWESKGQALLKRAEDATKTVQTYKECFGELVPSSERRGGVDVDRAAKSKAALLQEVAELEKDYKHALAQCATLGARGEALEFELKTARETIQRNRASHAAEIERWKEREKEMWAKEARLDEASKAHKQQLNALEIETDKLRRKSEEDHCEQEALREEARELRALLVKSRRALDSIHELQGTQHRGSKSPNRRLTARSAKVRAERAALSSFSRANREASETWANRELLPPPPSPFDASTASTNWPALPPPPHPYTQPLYYAHGYPPYYMGGSAPPHEHPIKSPVKGRRDEDDDQGEHDKENERKERGEERRLLATLAAQVQRLSSQHDEHQQLQDRAKAKQQGHREEEEARERERERERGDEQTRQRERDREIERQRQREAAVSPRLSPPPLPLPLPLGPLASPPLAQHREPLVDGILSPLALSPPHSAAVPDRPALVAVAAVERVEVSVRPTTRTPSPHSAMVGPGPKGPLHSLSPLHEPLVDPVQWQQEEARRQAQAEEEAAERARARRQQEEQEHRERVAQQEEEKSRELQRRMEEEERLRQQRRHEEEEEEEEEEKRRVTAREEREREDSLRAQRQQDEEEEEERRRQLKEREREEGRRRRQQEEEEEGDRRRAQEAERRQEEEDEEERRRQHLREEEESRQQRLKEEQERRRLEDDRRRQQEDEDEEATHRAAQAEAAEREQQLRRRQEEEEEEEEEERQRASQAAATTALLIHSDEEDEEEDQGLAPASLHSTSGHSQSPSEDEEEESQSQHSFSEEEAEEEVGEEERERRRQAAAEEAARLAKEEEDREVIDKYRQRAAAQREHARKVQEEERLREEARAAAAAERQRQTQQIYSDEEEEEEEEEVSVADAQDDDEVEEFEDSGHIEAGVVHSSGDDEDGWF